MEMLLVGRDSCVLVATEIFGVVVYAYVGQNSILIFYLFFILKEA